MKKTIMLLTLIALVSLCGNGLALADENARHSPLDPDKVPKKIDLYQLEPVLALTFVATKDGYVLQKSAVKMGAATQAVDLDRDVLITALDASGKIVARASIINPREIHTVGSKKPAKAVLDRALVFVTLPDPARIQTVTVDVKKGPNAALKKTFKVSTGGVITIPGTGGLIHMEGEDKP